MSGQMFKAMTDCNTIYIVREGDSLNSGHFQLCQTSGRKDKALRRQGIEL